jgi:hypothetical protein
VRTSYDEYDIRIGFSFLDSRYRLKVDAGMLLTYIYLRRYVWRGRDSRNNVIKRLEKDGFIVARISQSRLAESLGMSIRSIREYTKKLEELDWLIVKEVVGQGLYYVLGERAKATKGKMNVVAEVFYADHATEISVEAEKKIDKDTGVGHGEPRKKTEGDPGKICLGPRQNLQGTPAKKGICIN